MRNCEELLGYESLCILSQQVKKCKERTIGVDTTYAYLFQLIKSADMEYSDINKEG